MLQHGNRSVLSIPCLKSNVLLHLCFRVFGVQRLAQLKIRTAHKLLLQLGLWIRGITYDVYSRQQAEEQQIYNTGTSFLRRTPSGQNLIRNDAARDNWTVYDRVQLGQIAFNAHARWPVRDVAYGWDPRIPRQALVLEIPFDALHHYFQRREHRAIRLDEC